MTTNIYTTYHVTAEQVAKAHRFVSETMHQVIFKVESQTTVGEEYTVSYNRVHKCLVCTCPAGNPPIVDGRLAYAPRGCWHKRAALAAAAEYKQELIERNEALMVELQAEIDSESAAYTVVTDETSSSLDGMKWEMAPSGRLVPMR